MKQLMRSLWDPVSEITSLCDNQKITPQETILKLKDIRLKLHKKLGTNSLGKYRYLFKGHGLEFKNLREYQAGDEIRKIDWNVFARTGIPYVKEHYEEKQVSVWFFVDGTGSMFFGQKKSKFDYAIELAGLIGMLALESEHLVGLVLWHGDSNPVIVQPGGDSSRLYLIINELQKFAQNDSEKTSCYRGFPDLVKLFSNRCLVFMLSDFMFLDIIPDVVPMISKLSPKHEVQSILLVDPVEQNLVDDIGWIPLCEPFSRLFAWLNTSDHELLNDYRKMFKKNMDIKIKRLSGWSACRKTDTGKLPQEVLAAWTRSS